MTVVVDDTEEELEADAFCWFRGIELIGTGSGHDDDGGGGSGAHFSSVSVRVRLKFAGEVSKEIRGRVC